MRHFHISRTGNAEAAADFAEHADKNTDKSATDFHGFHGSGQERTTESTENTEEAMPPQISLNAQIKNWKQTQPRIFADHADQTNTQPQRAQGSTGETMQAADFVECAD